MSCVVKKQPPCTRPMVRCSNTLRKWFKLIELVQWFTYDFSEFSFIVVCHLLDLSKVVLKLLKLILMFKRLYQDASTAPEHSVTCMAFSQLEFSKGPAVPPYSSGSTSGSTCSCKLLYELWKWMFSWNCLYFPHSSQEMSHPNPFN